MSFNTSKEPAKWTQVDSTETHNVYVSEKGAIKLTPLNVDGTEDNRHYKVAMIMPEAFKTIVTNSDMLKGLFDSELYQQLLKSKAQAKDKQYLERKIIKEQEKAGKTIQAALDNLKALGIDPKSVFKSA